MSNPKIYTKSKKSAKEYAKRDAHIRSYVENDVKKVSARKRAEEMIYAHLSKWVGQEIEVGKEIPIVRDSGKFIGLSPTFLGRGPVPEVKAILDASKAINTPALRERLKALQRIKMSAKIMRDEIAEFDPGLMASAKVAARNLQPSLEGRIVDALGADVAAYMGLEVIEIGVIEQIAYLKHEIDERPAKKAGRAKDEAAHRVALEAARLYVKVTGETPTYSENQGIPYGKYTPFLRDVYNAFGWKERNLRTGAEAAISALVRNDYVHERIGLFGAYDSYTGK